VKYRPGLPDEHVNLPREPSWLQALKLTVSLAVIALLGLGLLSLAMNAAVTYITPEQERALTEHIRDDLNLTGVQNDALDRVTAKLSACVSLPYRVQAFVMDEEKPNAFALPGGVIYVSRGLMKQLRSENELAFVLGHELGHFKHRDHLRRFGYGLVVAFASVLLGDSASMAYGTALDLGTASYSREAEREADRFGLEATQCAYGSVTGATAFFERMAETEGWHSLMADHPGFKERIDAMRALIASKGMDTSRPPVPLGTP